MRAKPGWCRHCEHLFPSDRQRRLHPCPNRDVFERTATLRWETDPVKAYITHRFGVYDRTMNPEGYCATTVERLTGLVASTWASAEREGAGLTDAQADLVATALGRRHEVFWPGWGNALEVTDEDVAWLDAWRHGAVA